MTLPYTMRQLATSLALGVLVAACGGSPPKPDADAEVKKAEAKKPEPPKPAPQPEPEPEPPAKVLPKTLASMDAAIEAAVEIHSQRRRTFYCGCAYMPQLRIARGTCGYKTRAACEADCEPMGWCEAQIGYGDCCRACGYGCVGVIAGVILLVMILCYVACCCFCCAGCWWHNSRQTNVVVQQPAPAPAQPVIVQQTPQPVVYQQAPQPQPVMVQQTPQPTSAQPQVVTQA